MPHNLSSAWSESHTRALNALKRDFIKAYQYSLGNVRFDRPFEIYVDASATAAAGYVVQKDGDGIDRPISFLPRNALQCKAWSCYRMSVRLSVGLSVRLSVTLVDHDHIG